MTSDTVRLPRPRICSLHGVAQSTETRACPSGECNVNISFTCADEIPNAASFVEPIARVSAHLLQKLWYKYTH